jgi:hypothetical protein
MVRRTRPLRAAGALVALVVLALTPLLVATQTEQDVAALRGLALAGAGVAHAQAAAATPTAATVGVYNPTPNAGCAPDAVPVGQANPPGSQLEPLAPIWCFNLNPPAAAPCRQTGVNSWLDDFNCVPQYSRFQDGDYGYRVFDRVQNGGTNTTQHFMNNGHWMDDNAGGFQGGTLIRPDRSFVMENGTLVVEHDFAAGITGYLDGSGGDVAWGEMVISSAPQPTGTVVDGLYAYGLFGGQDTFGCRLHAGRKLTCSYEAARGGANGLDTNPCDEFLPDRLIEVSGFEQCGTTHFGGSADFGAPGQYFRQCDSAAQAPDMMCRDRFRMELRHDGLKVYVNGALYLEDSGWPARNQIPAQWGTSAQPLYVYFADWQDRPTQAAYRFHWDNMAINPHNPDGSFRAPSAAPNFCLGQPGNTCMGTPAPTATASPTVAPGASPTATPTPAATATATPSTGPTQTPARTATAGPSPSAAATASPTSVPAFTAGASVSPGTIVSGQTVAITAAVTDATSDAALVDLEVYDPGGTKVGQQYFDNQTFVAGQPRSYSVPWSAPAGATSGTYAVAVGVFSVGWGTVYAWNGHAAQFQVSAAGPTATATPTAMSTASPVPPTVTRTPTPTVAPTVTPTASRGPRPRQR